MGKKMIAWKDADGKCDWRLVDEDMLKRISAGDSDFLPKDRLPNEDDLRDLSRRYSGDEASDADQTEEASAVEEEEDDIAANERQPPSNDGGASGIQPTKLQDTGVTGTDARSEEEKSSAPDQDGSSSDSGSERQHRSPTPGPKE